MGSTLNDAIKNDAERERIRKILKESDSKYNYKKKEKPLFESLSSIDPDIIIEKYVILTHLISYEFRAFLSSGVNPFEVTVFKEVVAKKYPNQQTILAKFNEINEKYKSALHKTQNLFIKRIKTHELGGRNYVSSTYILIIEYLFSYNKCENKKK